jgi:hypothetical protein
LGQERVALRGRNLGVEGNEELVAARSGLPMRLKRRRPWLERGQYDGVGRIREGPAAEHDQGE